MTQTKYIRCRKIAVFFCILLIFFGLLPVTAHADNATVTSGSMYSYFQTYGSNGVWKDMQTPSHWITDTGEVAYCLQTSKDSPFNSGYHTVDGSDYYSSYVLTGLYAILENGYPVTTGGYTDEQARYATANAIRFWLAENYCDGVPQYLNLNVNGDWIRGRYGYEDLYSWSLSLVQLARDQAVSSSSVGTLSFSPAAIDLTESGDYFIGSAQVNSTLADGYGLSWNLPSGSAVERVGGDKIAIKVPIAYEQRSYTVTAYGVDNVETAKLFFWGPDMYNQQRVVTCVLNTESNYMTTDLTVNTPKATPKTGNLKIIKKDAYEDILLSGAGFWIYDSTGNVVAEQYTDHNGEVTFPDLLCGDYTYQEFKAPMGFRLDETVYPITISENGATITETRTDLRRPGTLVVKKQDADGNLLPGAGLLLEYSLDKGSTWETVFPRAADDTDISRGGCTSSELADGQLTTGEDGTVTFTGLRADSRVLYRLTETKAPEGHNLIGGALYVGTLPVESGNIYAEDSEVFDAKAYHYTLHITVTDDPLFRLPETGSSGFSWLPSAMMLMASPAIITKFKRRSVE